MFSCVGLVYSQILLDCKTTARFLSYELGVNDEKKVNRNWDIINKNGDITLVNLEILTV